MTKCGIFINETMGNIKSQLKEAIKSRILIGLLPLLDRFPSPLSLTLSLCLFIKSNRTKKKKVLNNCVCRP